MKFKPYCGIWVHRVEGDDEHFYRAVPDRLAHLVAPLEASKFFVPFERTDFTIDVGPHHCSVIKIKRLPFQVRIQELSRTRALQIVQFLVDFALNIHTKGLTPSDIHESNVLWWDGPVFVDFDALRPLTHASAALTFVRIAYLLYRYVFERPLADHATFDLIALRRLDGWMSQHAHYHDYTAPVLWQSLKNILTTVKIPPRPSHWSEEYGTGNQRTTNPKIKPVLDMLPPGRTLLDVGCNKGYVAELLRDRFDTILGFDVDEASVDKATPRPGLNFACFGIEVFRKVEPIPIHDRFRADAVVALAVTHHFQKAGFSVDFVVDTLDRLARRHLLIEDIVGIAEYARKFRARGFRVADSKPSFPTRRTLTLWERE